MKTNVRQHFLGLAAVATLALGGLGVTAFTSYAKLVAQTQPAGEAGDTVQDPSYTGTIPVDGSKTDGLSEADETAALQGLAKIDTATAEAAALAANPGATVVKSSLDNENGSLVYSVELSNGLDVKVDAGNGAILHTDQANEGSEGNADGEVDEANESAENDQAGDTDNIQDETQAGEQDEASDTDNLQDEQDGQPDDTNEASGAEDAVGQ
ncbi:MAG: PepSY domain-containing protein [Caldilineaceae bacterium]